MIESRAYRRHRWSVVPALGLVMAVSIAAPQAATAARAGQEVSGVDGVTIQPVMATSTPTPTPSASPTRTPRRPLPPPDVIPEPELGPIGLGLPVGAGAASGRGRAVAPQPSPTPTASAKNPRAATSPKIAPTELARPATAPELANPELANPEQANPELSNPDPSVADPIVGDPVVANGAVRLPPAALDGALIWAGAAALGTLLLIGGLIWWRRRGAVANDHVLASADAPVAAPLPPPLPAPASPPPAPAPGPASPQPASPAPQMLRRDPVPPPPPPEAARVTTPVLRPWVEIDFVAKRAGTNLTSATVDFELAVRNIGTVGATDVRILVQLLTANPQQNLQLQSVFERPTDQPIMAPFGLDPNDTARINAVGTLAIEKINRLDLEGRPMFVPIMAVRAVYSWPGNRGDHGSTANAYILGVSRDGQDKMQPLWLDVGPRMFDRITYRLHEIGLRK